MNKFLPIFIIALLCLTPTLAQFRANTRVQHFNNLNESVKAVLGSVLSTIVEASDSSDEGNTDGTDEVYDLSGLFAEPEDKIISKATKIEDVFTEVFGKDNKFFEGLMEMVAVNIEKIHDHANKFIDINVNDTDSGDIFSGNALENFKDFHGAIAGIIDNILGDSFKVDDDEYIVSSKQVSKPLGDDSKMEENNVQESSGNEESKDKVKNGLKTIGFIKSRLAKKAAEHGQKSHAGKGNKVLRRQNAMRAKDFEKYFQQEKENAFLNKLSE